MRRLALILSLLSLQACLSGCSVIAVADAAVTVVATTVTAAPVTATTAQPVPVQHRNKTSKAFGKGCMESTNRKG